MTETKTPVFKSGKKRREFPPSEVTAPNPETEEIIGEISRNLQTGNKNGSTKSKEKLEKLTSRIQPDLALWLKQTPPAFQARFGRKIKQETLVQIALRLLKDNPKVLELIDDQTK